VSAVDQLSPGQSARNHDARRAVAGADLAPAPAGLHDATGDARPVFPWRPLVLVLAVVDAPGEWAAAVDLVDDLQDVDVDARLALPSAPEATARSVRPARASETTLRTLRPDVVIAWDAEAVAATERWATGLRTLTIIERAGDGAEVDIVPWRIGLARGRVRGRFGSRAAAGDLVPLVHRLAAGPHPEAPDPEVVIRGPQRRWDVVDPTIGIHHRPPARTCTYVVGDTVPAASRRAADALAGHLGRANVAVTVGDLASATVAAAADIVLLQGVAGDPAAGALATRRAGRPTVFVLDEGDVGADGRLTAEAVDLASRCGAAIAPTDASRELLRTSVDGPIRAITLSPVMAADRYRALAAAQRDQIPAVHEVIAWYPAADQPVVDDAIEQALRSVLDAHPAVRVDVVGGGTRLEGHPLVRRLSATPPPARAARWAMFVTAGGKRPRLGLEPAVLTDVGVLGVPSIVPGGWVGAPGRVRVAEPEQAASWVAAISHLLDEVPTREELAFEAAAAAECLQRPVAADALVNRLLGWIDRGRMDRAPR
jgi:hypothetical protein